MALFTIPVHIVVDVPDAATALQQAQKANQLLNDPMTKTLIAGQGLRIQNVVVGAPKPK